MSLLGIWLAAASLAPQPAQAPDAVANARAFLEAFSKSPAEAKNLVTDDALIIIGDIGGPYTEFVTGTSPELRAKFQRCRPGSLALKPVVDSSKSVDELLGTGRDRHRKNGKVSVVEGQYLCSLDDGSNSGSKVTVVFEEERVAALALWSVQ